MSEAMTEMPRYRSHKTVWALKIKEIRWDGATPILVPEESGYAAFPVTLDYVQKHNPQVGGYYVQYKDGYKSFSPAAAFEEGYTREGAASS